MSNNEIITQDGEIITAPTSAEQMSLAIGLSRAEIDQQIATAHAFPRKISVLTDDILSLVTIDKQSAEECNYALPRGGKPITGPSIRLAEIVAGQWGNCRVGARVVHVDRAEKYVEAEGVFHDLQTNTATTARVRRRISDRQGRLLSDDMIIVTGNAACSIAKRNAILGGVPKAVWRKAHEAALATIKGDQKTLTERREGVLKAFAAFGVKPDQIFSSMGLDGLEDITLEHMPDLIGMHAALKSGEATVEEMFGMSSHAPGQAGGKQSLKDKLGDVAKDAKPEDSKAASDDQAADDDFPGDRPSEGKSASSDEIEAAKDRGNEAYHQGRSRKAIPQDYRASEALTAAWLAGYDAERDNDQGAQA